MDRMGPVDSAPSHALPNRLYTEIVTMRTPNARITTGILWFLSIRNLPKRPAGSLGDAVTVTMMAPRIQAGMMTTATMRVIRASSISDKEHVRHAPQSTIALLDRAGFATCLARPNMLQSKDYAGTQSRRRTKQNLHVHPRVRMHMRCRISRKISSRRSHCTLQWSSMDADCLLLLAGGRTDEGAADASRRRKAKATKPLPSWFALHRVAIWTRAILLQTRATLLAIDIAQSAW